MGVDLRLLRYFVVACEEGTLTAAAARLHMTQPPLSRAMRDLERDLGTPLLKRSAAGVSPTPAGRVLRDEARVILRRVERARTRVAQQRPPAEITVGLLADVVDHIAQPLLARFHRAHPEVMLRVHEADLTDPSAGLLTGSADVALTRAPLDQTGIATLVLSEEPVGVVVRHDDPITGAPVTKVQDLAHRSWVRLPDTAGPAWRTYWSGAPPGQHAEGPDVRTIQECVQSVLWGGAIAIAPLHQQLPDSLRVIPATDREANRILLAWHSDHATDAIRALVTIAES